MDVSQLPALNAVLNGSAALLLAAGWWAIKARRARIHARLMGAAFALSALFLVSYLTYHALHGHTVFTAQGWIRPVYFAILLTHVVLAAVVAPAAIWALRLAWTGRFDRHRRVTRWLLPVWLYVSVTGVVIYLILYHWYPAAS